MKDGVPWRVRKALQLAEKKHERYAGKIKPDHNPHAPRGIRPHTHERIFEGQVVSIIGGGPSLKDPVYAQAVRDTYGRSKVIAVNQSFEIAPWADWLHFADCAWWEWNSKQVLAEWNGIISTATSDVKKVNHPRLLRYWRDRKHFSTTPTTLHGWDSGTQAVNLAYHLGAKKIVLFGIDMQAGKDGATQWHTKHKRQTLTTNYSKFAASLSQSVLKLETLGVQVVRATEPGIPEAPWQPLEQCFQIGT